MSLPPISPRSSNSSEDKSPKESKEGTNSLGQTITPVPPKGKKPDSKALRFHPLKPNQHTDLRARTITPVSDDSGLGSLPSIRRSSQSQQIDRSDSLVGIPDLPQDSDNDTTLTPHPDINDLLDSILNPQPNLTSATAQPDPLTPPNHQKLLTLHPKTHKDILAKVEQQFAAMNDDSEPPPAAHAAHQLAVAITCIKKGKYYQSPAMFNGMLPPVIKKLPFALIRIQAAHLCRHAQHESSKNAIIETLSQIQADYEKIDAAQEEKTEAIKKMCEEGSAALVEIMSEDMQGSPALIGETATETQERLKATLATISRIPENLELLMPANQQDVAQHLSNYFVNPT